MVFVMEIEYLTNKIVEELGCDLNGKELFCKDEIIKNEWIGRNWRCGDSIIQLNFNDSIFLMIFPISYLDKK
jgi:hypothetical protein